MGAVDRRSFAFAIAALTALSCGRVGYDLESSPDATSATIDAAQGWWDSAFERRLRLTLDTSSISQTLTDMVLAVHITPNVFSYSNAAPDGADLRLVDGDGTELPYEIDTWNPGGESLLWVRLPELSPGTDHIWLYYQNSQATAPQRAEEVWSDFHAVYHLGEAPAGNLGEIADSTGGNHPGQGGGGDLSQLSSAIDAPLGRGQNFDGSNDLIIIEDSSSDSFVFTVPAVTVEAWVKFETSTTISCYFAKSGWSAGYRMCIDLNSRIIFQVTGMNYTRYSDIRPTKSTWHYVVGVWDGAQMMIYVDGVVDSAVMSRPGLMDVTGGQDLAIGHGEVNTGNGSSYPMTGSLDEIRVANVARSADWVRAQYLAAMGAMGSWEQP